MQRVVLLAAVVVTLVAVAAFILVPIPTGRTSAISDASVGAIQGVEAKRTESRMARESAASPATADGASSGEPSCPRKEPVEQSEEGAERFLEQMRDFARELSRSSDADHLFAAAAMLSGEAPKEAFDLLSRASTIAPTSQIIGWQRLAMCDGTGELVCSRAEVEAKARKVDRDNGAVWLNIAMLRLRDDEPAAAAAAMRQAIAAPRFDNYFLETALAIERGLAAQGALSYTERVIAGIGLSAAMTPPYYGQLTRQCRANDAEWIELCHEVGHRLWADGRELLQNRIGASLQRIAAEASGDEKRIEAARELEDRLKQRVNEFAGSGERQAVLENDETLLRQYLENFAAYGEIEAMQHLAADVERLRNEPGYDPCNFLSPAAGNAPN